MNARETIIEFLEDKEWLWDSNSKTWDTPTISEANRLTEVILPLIAAAWDEGWVASKRHERGEGQPKMTYWPNPYKQANA